MHPIQIAAHYNSAPMLEVLIDMGIDANAEGVNRSVALVAAMNNPELVRVLLEHGADPNHGKQVFWAARASLEAIKLLDQYGADLFRIFESESNGQKRLLSAFVAAKDAGLKDVTAYLLKRKGVLAKPAQPPAAKKSKFDMDVPPPLHPNLSRRPRPHPALQRPQRDHPILGKLEYFNAHPWGWWQSTIVVTGSAVRLRLPDRSTNVSEAELDPVAKSVRWIQDSEPALRSFAGQELATGRFRSNMPECSEGGIRMQEPAALKALRPYLLNWYDGWGSLEYDCEALPEGSLLKANCVGVCIPTDKFPVFLRKQGISSRAERLLEQPIPANLDQFENSLPDQFVSRAASWGSFEFDAELRRLLDQAIARTEDQMCGVSTEDTIYLRTVQRLLLDVAKEADAKPSK